MRIWGVYVLHIGEGGNMGAILKDKRIELWREFENGCDEDGFCDGFNSIKEDKIATLWAYYRHTSQKEFYAAAQVQYTEDAIFIVNSNRVTRSINPKTDYIMYNGKKFAINGVDDYQGGKRDIRISAKYWKK